MSAPTSIPKHTIYHDVLKEYWGYDDFRPLQLDIIESVGNGRDTLGLGDVKLLAAAGIWLGLSLLNTPKK